MREAHKSKTPQMFLVCVKKLWIRNAKTARFMREAHKLKNSNVSGMCKKSS